MDFTGEFINRLAFHSNHDDDQNNFKDPFNDDSIGIFHPHLHLINYEVLLIVK